MEIPIPFEQPKTLIEQMANYVAILNHVQYKLQALAVKITQEQALRDKEDHFIDNGADFVEDKASQIEGKSLTVL